MNHSVARNLRSGIRVRGRKPHQHTFYILMLPHIDICFISPLGWIIHEFDKTFFKLKHKNFAFIKIAFFSRQFSFSYTELTKTKNKIHHTNVDEITQKKVLLF